MDCGRSQFACAPQGAEACGTSFHATIGRLLFLCAPARKSLGDDLEELGRWATGAGCAAGSSSSGSRRTAGKAWGLRGAEPAAAEAEEIVEPRMTLLDLDDGVYFGVAGFLDAGSLGRLDVACRQLRELDRAIGGPWYQLGLRAYSGLELDGDGIFELDGLGTPAQGSVVATGRKPARVDWKGRFGRFAAEVPTFRAPFTGGNITEVQQADEIAYCRCRLRTDLLSAAPLLDDAGPARPRATSSCVYLEVEVLANPDNVSLAVVDFEAGGCSSVTFSPDTGAVIRERKVCETPRRVEGAYIQPLTTTTPGRGFEGSMGLFLQEGHLAFFRRHAARAGEGEDLEVGPWESTGFVTDLSWAEGRRLTPCLAFRNEGLYKVRMICMNSSPPVMPERNAMAYQESNWSILDWDAGQEDAPDM